ncbi:unnamed protein product [Euphydryas editha]|uniref:Uncharacterized protein n=1 Tax=Euphydryas editha TaxID=104508 RepID=A0AAU9VD60_EUPED|nr:unnamed protein product [Euphydryas editha]
MLSTYPNIIPEYTFELSLDSFLYRNNCTASRYSSGILPPSLTLALYKELCERLGLGGQWLAVKGAAAVFVCHIDFRTLSSHYVNALQDARYLWACWVWGDYGVVV